MVSRTRRYQSQTMTTGALIFAYNNEAIDYLRLAAWSASNIRRHLDIPVAVITDAPTDLDFDRVILHQSRATDSRWFDDLGMRVAWNNRDRANAFDLTPWDRTLLLDADYVVASPRLKTLLDHGHNGLLCHRWAHDITDTNDFFGLNHFGQYHMPMYWATVMIFDRSQESRHIFECMEMVRENWAHYKNIYHDRARTYRNDHALSIALNIVHGHQQQIDPIPWDLITALPEHRVSQVNQDRYRIDWRRPDNRPAWLEIADQDFHVMGKQSLMDIVA